MRPSHFARASSQVEGETAMKLILMGQWTTNKGLADCVELEGFGIVGAVIDNEGNGIVLNAALAMSELLAACESLAMLVDRGETNISVRAWALDNARAAIAKARGGAQ
jgi:hypothetical protein